MRSHNNYNYMYTLYLNITILYKRMLGTKNGFLNTCIKICRVCIYTLKNISCKNINKSFHGIQTKRQCSLQNRDITGLLIVNGNSLKYVLNIILT